MIKTSVRQVIYQTLNRTQDQNYKQFFLYYSALNLTSNIT